MKTYIKYILLSFVMVLALQSCSDETESEFPNLPTNNDWQFSTDLNFTPQVGNEAFIWEKNVLTLAEYWVNQEVVLNGNINSSLAASQFSKIDFYITAEEKNGYNFTPPFDTNGHLIKSVTDISEEGNFTLTIDAVEAYQLFNSNFVNDRSQTPIFEGDLFEIHWVITNIDGSTLDSRTFVDGEYRYSFAGKYQELAPPVWENIYDIEWLEGNDNLPLGLTAPITGGQIAITETAIPGTYNVPNVLINASTPFFSGFPGTLVFDFESGLTTVSDSFGLGITWHLSNINGSSIDVDIIGFGAIFGVPTGVYKVRLTRQDGADWPANVHH